MTKYIAKGLVVGNCWGGGVVGYAAETVIARQLPALKRNINRMLENGTLDSGMGYESLIGAIMEITKIHTIIKNNKEYNSTESSVEIFGDFGDIEEEWLEIFEDTT